MFHRASASSVPPTKDMASSSTARNNASNPSSKSIPLLCTVCPEAPRFSDVSHLLTHIASKGHLHHEAQTRLKSHQDSAASLTLHQYEQWYREHGIEALLVERMKAKVIKEASRVKRSRGSIPSGLLPKAAKRKPRRSSSRTIKAEQDDFTQDYAMLPNLFPTENDTELQEEFVVTGDMLSLKGQVWPGMGKMDLANEDMRRTRNQRKPNSVIEKMKRTSEGIEPTQVIMTSEFEIERIKGVYDETSSPSPSGDEQSPPRKAVKPRRKKIDTVLTEVSANIPRGGTGRARGHVSLSGQNAKHKHAHEYDKSSEVTLSLDSFRHSRDVFRDDDRGSAYDSQPFSTPSHRDQRFDLPNRLGIQALNPISHSDLVSPTPGSREIPLCLYSTRESHRERTQGHPYLNHGNHVGLGSFNHSDAPYALADASMYHNPGRLSFAPAHHFNTPSHDSYRLHPNIQAHPKQEEYSASTGNESLSNNGPHQFLHMPGVNPLFSQDRMLSSSYSQPTTNPSLSSLNFTPINRNQEPSRGTQGEQNQRSAGSSNIKLETQLRDVMDSNNSAESKESSFYDSTMWDTHVAEHEVELHDTLSSEQLGMQ